MSKKSLYDDPEPTPEPESEHPPALEQDAHAESQALAPDAPGGPDAPQGRPPLIESENGAPPHILTGVTVPAGERFFNFNGQHFEHVSETSDGIWVYRIQ